MDLEYDFSVLNDMMDDFDEWFPFDGTETEDEKEMYRNGFARGSLKTTTI